MPYQRVNNPMNTTSIDDLDEPYSTDKFIRASHNPPAESGMINRSYQSERYQPMINRSYQPERERHQYSGSESYQHDQDNEQPPISHNGKAQEGIQEHFATCQCSMCMSRTQRIPSYTDSLVMCPAIFEHIASCPVCKKLYGRDSDHTIYILIIIILLVACGLLFKRAFLN